MTGDHGPVQAAQHVGVRYRSRLVWSLGLVGSFFVVELVAGLLTGSIALVSDAGHMLTDAAGLMMALAAIQIAARPSRATHRTFGLYRLEILAALANAVALLALAGYVLVEGIRRFGEPRDIAGGPMLAVATAGLAVNLIAFALLRPGAKENLNVRGAYLEVVADTAGSAGVIIAGIVILTTGWPYVDPIAGLAIGALIVPRAVRLASQTLRILVQAAPPHLDLDAVHADLAALPAVVNVHDLHVWTLTSGMDVASAHLMVASDADMHGVLDGARDLLRARYRVVHATLQVEPEDHTGCEEISW